MQTCAVVAMRIAALVPPLFIAVVLVADKLKIHLPGDIVVFSLSVLMFRFGLPLSLILLVFSAMVSKLPPSENY